MRIEFFGSGAFAVPTLSALASDGHTILRVFTQPDRPAGRGGHTRPTPVKKCAAELDIPVVQPHTLRDGQALAWAQEDAPDVGVVVAYGHLIPRDLLQVPAHGFINLHASLLPKYRGAAPVPHAILEGEKETGSTVFRLNERWDAGDILGRTVLPIRDDDTTGSLLERMAEPGADLVRETVGQLAGGWVQALPQKDAEATSAPKLTKEMGHIDWSGPRDRIERMTRAFQPWPLAYTTLHAGKGPVRLAVLAAEPAAMPHHAPPPGTVVHADPKDGLIVMAGDGPLFLRKIKPEGKRAMTGLEYLRGARIKPGMRLE